MDGDIRRSVQANHNYNTINNNLVCVVKAYTTLGVAIGVVFFWCCTWFFFSFFFFFFLFFLFNNITIGVHRLYHCLIIGESKGDGIDSVLFDEKLAIDAPPTSFFFEDEQ